MSIQFLGYDLFDGTVAKCADEIVAVATANERTCKTMACLNPHSYVVARRDYNFSVALLGADWLVPDGVGVVWGAKILRHSLPERVSGPDVFTAVMSRLNECGGSVFFLGSTWENLERIKKKTAKAFPRINLAGFHSPPFKPEFAPEDNADMIEAINSARPDVLWIGMTAPKQEKWLQAHRSALDVNVAGAVGAAFDFFSGEVKRSHQILQLAGLEWLPRLLQQPRRLWRRMAISAPIFIADVMLAKLKDPPRDRRG